MPRSFKTKFLHVLSSSLQKVTCGKAFEICLDSGRHTRGLPYARNPDTNAAYSSLKPVGKLKWMFVLRGMRHVTANCAVQISGIVQLHYYFEDEYHVLLLLEYASGGSLFSLLRRVVG